MLTGQTILCTGHIPRFDSYSYSAAGLPWYNHEWLSQVELALRCHRARAYSSARAASSKAT
jgi:hypothetical protein